MSPLRKIWADFKIFHDLFIQGHDLKEIEIIAVNDPHDDES
jgi:hypothetical protein